jgi:hypothetical protein
VDVVPRAPYLSSVSDAAGLLKMLVVVHKGLSNTADTLFLLSSPFLYPFSL